MALFNSNYYPGNYMAMPQSTTGTPGMLYTQGTGYQPVNQQPTNSIIWVQGIEGAKSHPVAAGTSAILMDSESPVFYIKTVNINGMPEPLEIYSYERVQNDTKRMLPIYSEDRQSSDYVTTEEFKSMHDKLSGEIKDIHMLLEDLTGPKTGRNA